MINSFWIIFIKIIIIKVNIVEVYSIKTLISLRNVIILESTSWKNASLKAVEKGGDRGSASPPTISWINFFFK